MNGNRRGYDMRRVVTFEETNLVGNVYYVNVLKWQGACREMFLRDHAPDVVEDLHHDLALVTVRCECDYFAELAVFDTIVCRLRLADIAQNRLELIFDVLRTNPDATEELVARGRQVIGCMRRGDHGLEPIPVPDGLRQALEPFR